MPGLFIRWRYDLGVTLSDPPWNQPSLQVRTLFYRCLGSMFQSGVPLVAALEHLAETSDHPRLREATRDVVRRVQAGEWLSRSMARQPRMFGAMECRLIQTGEQTGRLAEVLLRLSRDLEQQVQLLRRFQASLVTPLIVSGFCLMLVLLLPPMLFRGIFEILLDAGQPLPLPTRLLIGLSQWLCHPLSWLMAGVGLGIVIPGLSRLLSAPSRRARLEDLFLATPGVGPCYASYLTLQFARTLRCSLDVGLPLLKSLELAARSTSGQRFPTRIGASLGMLENGEPLSRSLAASGLLPPDFLQSLRAGEESGRLTDLLACLERLQSLQFESRLSALSQLLEPLMLTVIGGIVGFVCLASLLPLARLLESL